MQTEGYGRSAALYDYVTGPLTASLARVRMKLAPPLQNMKVLDIGCGTGSDLRLYSQAGCDVYGVDLSAAMLKVARKKLGDAADLRHCDATQLPFPDNFFGLVLSAFSLHEMNWEKRPVVVREMARVAKADGRILLTDFHSGPYRFPDGWLTRAVIFAMEVSAGREHFNNGRDFLRRGGLRDLTSSCSLATERSALVSGGNIAFHLLGTATS